MRDGYESLDARHSAVSPVGDSSGSAALAVAAARGGRFGDLILNAIRQFGDRTAFVDDGRECTYRALGDRIAQALAILAELALRPGDTVAQLSGNSVDLWATMAAAYIGGYRSVTLHPLGSSDDQAAILRDCAARVLIVDAKHHARAAELQTACDRIFSHDRAEGLPCVWDRATSAARLPLTAVSGSEDIIRIAYTGGTTGRAKGVLLSNRAMIANAVQALAGIAFPAAPQFLCPAPISHGAGSIIVPTLMRGGTVILQHGFEPSRFAAEARQRQATVTWLVPTMIAGLLDLPASTADDLASLRAMIWSGAPMTPVRVRQAVDRFGPILVQCYGQSEAPNTILTIGGKEHALHPDAAGRPFPGIEVALLDDAGNAVPPGSPGEICVRGPLVMSGYLNLPVETAAAFADGWLHTGDIGTVDDDGLYRIVDRKKDMLITGGFNVHPREIEDVLAAQAGVAAVAVVGVPDDRWGEAVTAVIVAMPGVTLDPARLIASVRDAKGPVHAPKTVHVVDQIPLTPLGKPDKKAMVARYATSGG